MTEPEAGRPWGFDVAASPIGASYLETALGHNAHWYFQQRADAFPKAAETAASAAQPFARHDVQQGIEIRNGSGKAFYRGELLGMTVIREFFSAETYDTTIESVRKLAAAHLILMRHSDYSRTSVTEASLSMIRGATPGWDAVRPYYESFFQRHDIAITEDERFRRHARLGLGFVLGRADNVWQKAVNEAYLKLMGEVDVGVNDEAINAFLDGQS